MNSLDDIKIHSVSGCVECPFYLNGSKACVCPTLDTSWRFVGENTPPEWCPLPILIEKENG